MALYFIVNTLKHLTLCCILCYNSSYKLKKKKNTRTSQMHKFAFILMVSLLTACSSTTNTDLITN